MSQDSITPEQLANEIEQSQVALDNLLAYSKEKESLILPEKMASTSQTVNFWSQEELTLLTEWEIYHSKVMSLCWSIIS
jgi:hypothetical protein